VDAAMESLVMNNLVTEGEKVVITTGFPVSASGTTNMLLVQTVGMVLFNSPSLIKKEASGAVCIARTAAEAKDKMKNGDILVTRSACADYLPAMKKAAAFITEEIGMANFTAMTALQLGIPCITGALGASEKLEDGMLITVDGVHGVVYEGRMRII
jgi:pyruvate kinase